MWRRDDGVLHNETLHVLRDVGARGDREAYRNVYAMS
jgi:hypothetical protein